jgi:hypothetical protein
MNSVSRSFLKVAASLGFRVCALLGHLGMINEVTPKAVAPNEGHPVFDRLGEHASDFLIKCFS